MPEMQGAADVLMVAGPVDLPRAALGAGDRLVAVRPAASATAAGALLHARAAAQGAREARERGLRIRRRPGGRVPRLPDHGPAPAARGRRPAGQRRRTSSCSPPATSSSPSTRYDQLDPVVELLRKDLAGAAAAAALLRGRVRPEPARVHARRACRAWPPADAMMLFRSAVKQIARRHGYHATFMCRPKLPNVMSSGWHLHQSPVAATGRTLSFPTRKISPTPESTSSPGCSPTRAARLRLRHADRQRLQALPPLLARARPRRLGQGEPRRAAARDRRPRRPRRRASRTASASPRRIPTSTSPRRSTAGWTASQRKLPLPRSADTPYEAKAELLPRTLAEALQRLREDKALREGFGNAFVDYYCRIKEAEIARFNLEVSDWEQREYFDLVLRRNLHGTAKTGKQRR